MLKTIEFLVIVLFQKRACMANKNKEFNLIIDANLIQKEYFKDIFRYRELFYFMAWRDIVVRYKQTFLGIIWAIIRPLLTMAVFAFVFGKIAKLSTDQVNYPLFVLSGLLPWMLFANTLVDTSQVLINNAPMISKVYFPRIILPISAIMVQLVDFLISFTLLLLLLLFNGSLHEWSILGFPFFIFSTLVLCLGTGLWVAAISIRYRDFRFIVPFLVQFGIFISPVGYSSFLLSESSRWIYFLNPMAGLLEGFRWCCFGIYHSDLPLAIGLSCLINGVVLILGFRYFRNMERVCADII